MKVTLPKSSLRRSGETSGLGFEFNRTQSDAPIGFPGRAGFTMVEIALSLAIIGFALVAIIGVLPTGLNVQRENREDTIINQEGAYLLEAIRTGSQRQNVLTNYLDELTVTTTRLNNGALVRNLHYIRNPTNPVVPLTGYQIVGYLSTPKYGLDQGTLVANRVTAKLRAQSGPALNRAPSESVRDLAFSYLLQSEIVPYSPFPTNYALTNFTQTGLSPAQRLDRQWHWAMGRNQETNLYELRLTLRWPVYGSPGNWKSGGSQQIFRTLVSGNLRPAVATEPFYFFQPSVHGP